MRGTAKMESGPRDPGVADSIEQVNDSGTIPACEELLLPLSGEYEHRRQEVLRRRPRSGTGTGLATKRLITVE